MSGLLHITIDIAQAAPYLKDLVDAERKEPLVAAENIGHLLKSLIAGGDNGRMLVMIDDDDGDGVEWEIACTQADAAGHTVTIAGVTFTEVASPSSNPLDNEFTDGANDTATAANLAAAINDHIEAGGDLAGLFSDVSADTGTVTLVSEMGGIAGNLITITTDETDAFAITVSQDGETGVLSRGARAYTFGVTP